MRRNICTYWGAQQWQQREKKKVEKLQLCKSQNTPFIQLHVLLPMAGWRTSFLGKTWGHLLAVISATTVRELPKPFWRRKVEKTGDLLLRASVEETTPFNNMSMWVRILSVCFPLSHTRYDKLAKSRLTWWVIIPSGYLKLSLLKTIKIPLFVLVAPPDCDLNWKEIEKDHLIFGLILNRAFFVFPSRGFQARGGAVWTSTHDTDGRWTWSTSKVGQKSHLGIKANQMGIILLFYIREFNLRSFKAHEIPKQRCIWIVISSGWRSVNCKANNVSNVIEARRHRI